jgi:hypothetical protein
MGGRPTSTPQTARALDHRTLSQLEKFDGSQGKWLTWRKAFVCAIRAQSPSIYDKLMETEKSSDEVDEDLLSPEVSKWSGEVYNILAMWCTGDAAAAMQAVPDCQGLRAWQSLVRRFQPRTAARAITLMQAVTRPEVVQEMNDVHRKMADWEASLRQAREEFGEQLSECTRIGILASMMPNAVKEYITQIVELKSSYEDVAARVRAFAQNRVGLMPSPTQRGCCHVRPGRRLRSVGPRCGGGEKRAMLDVQRLGPYLAILPHDERQGQRPEGQRPVAFIPTIVSVQERWQGRRLEGQGRAHVLDVRQARAYGCTM